MCEQPSEDTSLRGLCNGCEEKVLGQENDTEGEEEYAAMEADYLNSQVYPDDLVDSHHNL